MSDFRARDADRDRAVAHIEAAFAGGQIGAADRELRVTRARSAETLDELEALTRDLRVSTAPDVVRRVPAAVAGSAPVSTRRPGRLVAAVGVLGAVVALLGVGVASLVLVAGSGSDSPDSSISTVEVPVPSGEAAAEEPGVARFEMTSGQVRRFLRAHAREFGTREAFEVVLNPARVSVGVPVRGPRPRVAGWTYDGTWRQGAEVTAVVGSAEKVDLGTIDVGRLFANIATATKVLRVPKGELTHVVVRRRAGESAAANIYVGNAFSESGYLSTMPSGEEIRRYPYES